MRTSGKRSSPYSDGGWKTEHEIVRTISVGLDLSRFQVSCTQYSVHERHISYRTPRYLGCWILVACFGARRCLVGVYKVTAYFFRRHQHTHFYGPDARPRTYI